VPKNPGPTNSIVDSSENTKNPGNASLAHVHQTNNLALDLDTDMFEHTNLKAGIPVTENTGKITTTNNGRIVAGTPPESNKPLSESHSFHTQHICELDSDSESMPNPNSSASSSVFKAPFGFFSRKLSRCKRNHLIDFEDAASTNGSSVTNPIRLDKEMDYHLSTEIASGLKHSNLSDNIDEEEDDMMIDEPISSQNSPLLKAISVTNITHCKRNHLINFEDAASSNGSSATNPICLYEEMDCHLSTEFASSGSKHSILPDNIDEEEDHTMIDEPISSRKSPLLKAISVTNITCSFAQGLQAKLVNQASGLKQSNLSNNIDEEEDHIMMNEPISSPTNLKSPLLKAICVNDHKCSFAQGLQAKRIGQLVDTPKGSSPYNERNTLTSPKKKTRLNSSPSKNKSQNGSTSKSVTSMSKKKQRMGKIAFNNHKVVWC